MHLICHEPVTVTLLGAWGRRSGVHLALTLLPYSTFCLIQAGKWYQEGEIPLPTCSRLAKGYLRSPTLGPYPTILRPTEAQPLEGSEYCSSDHHHSHAPKAPSRPCPLWKGPVFEIPEKQEKDWRPAWQKEKRGARMEKGGFQTERLTMESD